MENPAKTLTMGNILDLNPTEFRNFMAMVRGAQVEKSNQLKRSLRLGDKVSFTGRGGVKVTGTVTKINRKTVYVKETTDSVFGTTWRVSPSLLTKESK